MEFKVLGRDIVRVICDVPVLKQRIFRWFPSSGWVRASTVGAKNMASSSGWAINRQMRLLTSLGKERVKGETEVEDMVQKAMTAAMATTSAVRLDSMVSVRDSQFEFNAGAPLRR